MSEDNLRKVHCKECRESTFEVYILNSKTKIICHRCEREIKPQEKKGFAIYCKTDRSTPIIKEK